jgi:hypothetical protein
MKIVMVVTIRVLKMPGGRYYTFSGDVPPTILGFVNGPSAHACKAFLERKRSVYGYFPNQTKNTETHQITVETEELSKVQQQCLDYNIGLLGIHYFDLSRGQIDLQAEDFSNPLGLDQTDPRRLLQVNDLGPEAPYI